MSHSVNEIQLARQLANSLVIPIFIVDTEGGLMYYNESAEEILGKRFDNTGPMPAAVWGRLFEPRDDKGLPLVPEELPLVEVLSTHHPIHKRFWIHGMDGVKRHIEVTAFPLLGHSERFLGAVAMFWDVKDNNSPR